MNPDILAGAILVSSAIIGFSMWWSKEREIKARYSFDARKSKEYQQVKKEADQWRQLYEEERAKTDSLNSLLKVQRLVLEKTKVKDMQK